MIKREKKTLNCKIIQHRDFAVPPFCRMPHQNMAFHHPKDHDNFIPHTWEYQLFTFLPSVYTNKIDI